MTMNNNIDNIGNEKLPSIISDPFSKTKVTSIRVSYQDFWGKGEWKATGTVKFKNGNTEAEQNFEGETFDEVVLKIKAMLSSLD